MENIEVELRSFITPDVYTRLLDFFHAHARFLSEDNQITYYFTGPHDLRIQKNDHYAKIWMKKWNLHDEAREEIEIKFEIDDFDKLKVLFLTLGYDIEIIWLRKRIQFSREGIEVSLDDTKWYGMILELEILTNEEGQPSALERLQEKFKELEIDITSKEEFNKQYELYKNNWKSMISEY